jgi:hypothetical protein
MNIATLRAAFIAGNNAGDGFAPASGETDCEAAATAMGELLYAAQSADDVYVTRTAAGRLIAIGDANGAWCVDVTDAQA